MRPTEKDKRVKEEVESIRDQQQVERRVEKLKDKVRILVETPLFLNADLLSQGLV